VDKETSNPERLVSQPEPANGQQRPCYFLSVEVENVRSFKESQTLRLSNSRGQPAKWTILIGDNGVGKTTLLQVLASFQSAKLGVHVSSEQTKTILVPRMFSDLPRSLTLFLRAGAESLRCKANIAFGQKLTEPERASQRLEFEVRIEANFKAPQRGVFSGAFPPDVNAFVCYGYGSGRRMSERALAESRHDDTCKTLFEEGEPLLNAEEWLLQADYAAIKTASPGARDKRDQIIDILRRVLPDVPELRIQPGNASLVPAAVEAKTPYGWVPLRSVDGRSRKPNVRCVSDEH
jgi:energy-coupling factor transporter ATP-binding protein EcfA2